MSLLPGLSIQTQKLKKVLNQKESAILLGPIGSGKSFLIKELAKEYNENLIFIGQGTWLGQTEEFLQKTFSSLEEGWIVIEGLDLICNTSRLQSVLGNLLDLYPQRSCLATLHGLVGISPSLQRRFTQITFGIATKQDRREILSWLLDKIPNNLTKEEIFGLADSLHGYTGADIDGLIKEAGMMAVK